ADGAPLADKEVLAGAVGEFVSHYRAHIADHSRPFPGAVETLIDMQNAGAVCVICTNKREALAVALLEALDLTDCFSAIVGGDNASAAKPDPAPVRLSMAQAGFEPDAVINAGRAVFIGDSDTDIRAAKNTGVPVLLHNQGYGPLSEAAHVDGAFDQFDQLPNLVRGLIK
ncbi:MAG: HAD hydrolase-like protein, partial [Pseudomonadota bacterium]